MTINIIKHHSRIVCGDITGILIHSRKSIHRFIWILARVTVCVHWRKLLDILYRVGIKQQKRVLPQGRDGTKRI